MIPTDRAVDTFTQGIHEHRIPTVNIPTVFYSFPVFYLLFPRILLTFPVFTYFFSVNDLHSPLLYNLWRRNFTCALHYLLLSF